MNPTVSFAARFACALFVVFLLAASCPAAVLDEPAGAGQAGQAIPRGAKNLFLKAKCTADRVWSTQTPDRAVNGNRSAGDHWAGPPIPAKHTVDLGKAQKLNTIRIITYFNGRRYYQYFVEVSTDGQAWKVVVDQRGNRTTATAAGRVFTFEPLAARYVRTTFTKNSQNNEAGGHIVEIEGYMIDKAAAKADKPAKPLQEHIHRVQKPRLAASIKIDRLLGNDNPIRVLAERLIVADFDVPDVESRKRRLREPMALRQQLADAMLGAPVAEY